MAARLAVLLSLIWAAVAAADPVRIATYNTELGAKGPGIFLRDILRGKTDDILSAIDVIRETDADILVLQGIDYDLDGVALGAFADAIGGYPHRFALPSNFGMRTGIDMDRDGYDDNARDTQAYGRFRGQGGMAILSRHPIERAGGVDFSDLLWRDFPNANIPMTKDGPFFTDEVWDIQRLSSGGHWVVPVLIGDARVTIMAFYPTPPVFDGPEDRNGKRNGDEINLWRTYLDGGIGHTPPADRFLIVGDANNDPDRGAGLRDTIRALLAHPKLQDPLPDQTTVDWGDVGAGKQRVDYVLPSVDLTVIDAGLGPRGASRHHPVWVDINLP